MSTPAPAVPAPEARPTASRYRALSAASVRRPIEPDTALPWGTLGPHRPGDAPVVAPELLSVADLDLDLDADTTARLSREELASMLSAGIRFEAGLSAGLSMQVLGTPDVTDPRVTYLLHETGEETRHSRAFARLVAELGPTATDPMRRPLVARLRRRIARSLQRSPLVLDVMTLAGEEVPDLIQRIAAEHPDTHELVASVNRYHRQEEARHLAYARTALPELWAEASARERWRVRHVAPLAITALVRTLVHPGVYAAVGLPPLRTWRAAQRSEHQRRIRWEGTRPVLAALVDAGAVRPGRVPRAWRRLCHVDRHGRPLEADVETRAVP